MDEKNPVCDSLKSENKTKRVFRSSRDSIHLLIPIQRVAFAHTSLRPDSNQLRNSSLQRFNSANIQRKGLSIVALQ